MDEDELSAYGRFAGGVAAGKHRVLQAGLGGDDFRGFRVPGEVFLPGGGVGGLWLFDADQLDEEDKIIACLDHVAARLVAIGKLARDVEEVLVARRHLLQAHGPAGDDLVQAEGGRCAAIKRRVELLAGREAAFIMDFDAVGRDRLLAAFGAFLQHDVLQAHRAGLHILAFRVPGKVLLEGCGHDIFRC